MENIPPSGEWGASFSSQTLLTLVLVFQTDVVRGRQTEDALHHQDQIVHGKWTLWCRVVFLTSFPKRICNLLASIDQVAEPVGGLIALL